MNQEKLTSEQAFNLVLQLAHQVKLTLAEGEQVKQALQTIADIIREHEANKSDMSVKGTDEELPKKGLGIAEVEAE